MALNYRLRVSFPVTNYRLLQAQWGNYVYTGTSATLSYFPVYTGVGGYPDYYTVPSYAELAPADGVPDSTGTQYHPGARWWSTSFISWKGNIPGCYFYDYNQRVQWNNEGGDWYDANGVAQGATPYATTTVVDTNDSPTDHLVTWNVTTLVQQWLAGTHKNYGFFLKCNDTGITRYRSRFYTDDVSKRPVLTLTTPSGPVDVACARSIFMPSGQETPLIEPQYLEVSRNSRHLLLWFNLEAYNGTTITGASLKMYTHDQYGNSNVEVYRTWNPADQGSIGPQVLGLAANYDRDQGIENHPDVLFVQKFADANWQDEWLDASVNTALVTNADGNGFTPLVGLYNAVKCTQYAGGPYNGSLYAMWSPWRDGTTFQFKRLKPAAPKERLFLRYYLMFGNDWAPMPNSGKLPGFDMRYATLQTGMGLDYLPNMGRGNSSNKCDGLCGSSARGSYDRKRVAGSPLEAYGGIGFAGNYNIDDTTNNGTPVFLKNHYLAALAKGRWHSVEVELQMNTVTQPTQKPRQIAAMSAYDGVVSVTLSSAESDLTVYANGVRWSFGGSTQYTPGYNTTAPITVIDSTHFTFAGAVTTASISSITKGASRTRVVVSSSHGVPNGTAGIYSVKIGDVVGMTELNGNVYLTDYVNTTTLDLHVDSTGFGSYVSGGKCTLQPVKATGAQNNVIEFQACPGEGNKDGVMRVWVNGRLAGEHTDLRWRHSRYVAYPGSTINGIDVVWFDEYQGGAGLPQNTCSLYMADMVVADSYIGPLVIPSQTPDLPAWAASASVNEWIRIPDSSLADMDFTPQQNAGLTNSSLSDIGYGWPTFGITGYSGAALKSDGSEFLIFGGGGAGAWAGNDVRAIRLEDAAPRWRTVVNPSNVSNVWTRGGPGPHPYMRDGVTPNARHSYYQPQFIDSQNRFYAVGCQNVWEIDSGTFYVVDSVAFTGGSWTAPGMHPNIPILRGWDGAWQVKHPTTEEVYCSGNYQLAKFNAVSNSWTTLLSTAWTGLDRGCAAIDPVSNTILRIGVYSGANNVPVAIDLATNTVSVGTLTGPYAGVVNIGGSYGAALAWDDALGKFLFFQDDSYVYTITRATPTTWYVDRMTTVQTNAPQPGSTGNPILVLSHFQYVPALRGVVLLVRNGLQDMYYMRTS